MTDLSTDKNFTRNASHREVSYELAGTVLPPRLDKTTSGIKPIGASDRDDM